MPWLVVRIAAIPVSAVTRRVPRVVHVPALGRCPLVWGHWTAWQAARVEVNQEAQATRRQHRAMAVDVVHRLVKGNDLEARG